ncbi:MAG TPA: CbiX/SirB N-terminal domain-containing protein [Sporichthyaceae bacterium]|nr:CbiX/SirB N-terminal domain-containing protein [Sporichthyaceae bacterium]
MTVPALLLVAHGSRDARHAATMDAIADRLRGVLPDLRVGVGYLDHDGPDVADAAMALGGPVRAVPMLLSHAFHHKVDLPGALAKARARGAVIEAADPLGPDPALLVAAAHRLRAAGAQPGPGTGLVLAYAGTRDSAAATAVLALARRWQRRTGAEVRVAHAAATGPGLAAMVAQLRAGGAHRVDVAPWFLAPGRLLDATRAAAHLAGADTVAAPLGDAPAVIEAVLHRFDAGGRARPAA